MIQDERLVSYICSLEGPKSPLLEDLRKEALETDVPIVRAETEALLSFFVDYVKPKQILEVGCAIGYSSILMAGHMAENCHITTMENWPPRIEKAKENFKKANLEERITLLEGDATEILKDLEGPYDLVFMDAAKAQYINWLPDVLRLLSPEGVLISDNILQDGDVLESRFAVRRRDRTIHKRMREYLYELKHNAALSTMVLPLGDGVAVTTKVRK